MAERHLYVVLDGELVGDAFEGPRNGWRFEYDARYRQTGRVPLSPALPINDTAYDDASIRAYVEGLLPERAEVRETWARALATSTDAFDLIAGMGLDCIGAVQFTPDLALARRTSKFVPVTAAHLGERLRNLRATEADWTLPGEHWSLPGAQEKFTLTYRDGRWYEPHGAAASTHIVKPGVTRLKHQAVLEHATMRVARALGLTVANSELLTFDGEEAIVVERFDRYWDGNEIGRLHQADFVQAMGRLPANKYEERNGTLGRDLAKMIRAESFRPEVDVRRFSDAILFNYIVGAPDAHAKNYALLYAPDGRRRLAPLYDMSSSFAYDPRGGGYNLTSAAMNIGGRRKFGEVQYRHFVRHAEEFKLSVDERLSRIREMAQRVAPTFDEVLTDIGTPSAKELAERLLPRLTNHANSVIGRLDIGTAE